MADEKTALACEIFKWSLTAERSAQLQSFTDSVTQDFAHSCDLLGGCAVRRHDDYDVADGFPAQWDPKLGIHVT